MANTLNTHISLRKDCLSNWISSDIVLANGELAIVVNSDGSEDIKLGNGISSFTQLPFLYQDQLKSDKVVAKDITAKSISQGYNVKATPTSFATGVFVEADGNFNVVHGIEAQAKEGDDYAFVFNGTNLPGITERYQSHGEGTFNVNPLSGLSGFYVGDESLAQKFYEKGQLSSAEELKAEFAKHYTIQQSNALYTDLDSRLALSSEVLCSRIDSVSASLSDYVSSKDAGSMSAILSNAISADVKNLADNYWKKSETSSASQLSGEFAKYQLSGNYLSSTDLSIEYLSSDNTVTLSVQNAVQKAQLPRLSRVIMNTWTD